MRVYYRNKDGYYYYPLVNYLSFWLFIAIVLFFGADFLEKIININFFLR